ncbi:glutaredoxin family protein [Patescibacteria group bacterium]
MKEQNTNLKHKIRVFGTPTCPYCHTLKLFLDEKGFKYDDVDISVDDDAREEMTEKSGQIGTPVIDIDGEFIVGFDKKKISELLNIK